MAKESDKEARAAPLPDNAFTVSAPSHGATLTLRQIEVVRAVMMTGTTAGAARHLSIAQPGISRTMKHLEATLGVKLFVRRQGRYEPAAEAKAVFEQLNEVYAKIEDLRFAVAHLGRGENASLAIASVPSIANVMAPRAIAALRKRHPKLLIDFDILKIEDAIDYLMLGRGELVAMSYRFDHPSVRFMPLASGQLVAIMPPDHPLAEKSCVTAAELAAEPLIGIDPTDPYGAILTRLFHEQRLSFDVTIRVRFGATVTRLVQQGLGVAIVDIFTVAQERTRGLVVRRIVEDPRFETFVAVRRDTALSSYAERFVKLLQLEMESEAIAVERQLSIP